MYHVKTMNKISKIGLAELDDRFEISDTMEHEDAILVRSAKLHDYDFPAELLCIARAGAGVNNIPLDRAAEAGIVVFNTPGANANGVKELTIAALLLASRKISQGITWVKEQAAAGADVAAVVEKGKAAYVGPEIQGKTLGVVGLGAIGVLVANAAAALGMQIVGYDPFLNELYLRQGRLHVELMTRGMAWLDTGTPEGMLNAAQYVEAVQSRQGLYIACPEEIAWEQGFISDEEVAARGQELRMTEYGQYLLSLVK